MATLSVTPRVLSIQSHVVSGYCGNKSATFPLQLLEFEVDVVNTVQLSNHTQYEVTRGQIYGSKDLEDIHSGLKANNLLRLYDHILSGYVADVSYVESMAKLVKDIKMVRAEESLDCWYTFDPVLGDDGTGFYVPNGEKVADTYVREILPLADMITPNRFEASVLSGIEISHSFKEALPQVIRAIDHFHKLGVRIVVITSFQSIDREDELTCIVSYRDTSGVRSNDNLAGSVENDLPESEIWMIHVPKLDCAFTGTGDLFAALMTAWLHKTNFDLRKSLENTANTIHGILLDTLEWYKQVNNGSVQSYELRLVQNKKQILCPSNKFKAERVQTDCLS